MTDTRTINGIPIDLLTYEIRGRIEKAEADARGKTSCHYQADRLARKVATDPWLTRHPANSPERRAARKQLSETADMVQAWMAEEGLTKDIIVAEHNAKQAAQSEAGR